MPQLVVLVEEESMQALLDVLLPQMLPEGWLHKVIKHQGARDLEASIPRKLKSWRARDARFIVLRDNDRADCRARKAHLAERVKGTGREAQTKIRIVCQELEAWEIGDLQALETAKGPVSSKIRREAAAPDTIDYPHGLLETHYGIFTKVSSARAIAKHMLPDRNTSCSFHAFAAAVAELMAD